MKKLLLKDKKLRLDLKNQEKRDYIYKIINQNSHIFNLIRRKIYHQQKSQVVIKSIVSLSPRCVFTINRKRFNKIAPFSRQFLLKLFKSGKLSGIRKSCS